MNNSVYAVHQIRIEEGDSYPVGVGSTVAKAREIAQAWIGEDIPIKWQHSFEAAACTGWAEYVDNGETFHIQYEIVSFVVDSKASKKVAN